MQKLKKHFCQSEYLLAILLMISTSFIVISPHWAEFLQYDRQAIFSGQIWRLWTSHLCHWNGSHYFWNTFTFAVLVILQKQWQTTSLWRQVLLIMPLISLGLLFVEPQMQLYRGLSGFDCALAANIICLMLNEESRRLRAMAILILVAWLQKFLYSLCNPDSLFVESSSFRVILAAHILGGSCSILFNFVNFLQANQSPLNIHLDIHHDQ